MESQLNNKSLLTLLQTLGRIAAEINPDVSSGMQALVPSDTSPSHPQPRVLTPTALIQHGSFMCHWVKWLKQIFFYFFCYITCPIAAQT